MYQNKFSLKKIKFTTFKYNFTKELTISKVSLNLLSVDLLSLHFNYDYEMQYVRILL